jgi:hypothetical protein|tara:strand:- start:2017 stop:2517 length:501 start_codon:yes stop_codon:yes gene_type:complete
MAVLHIFDFDDTLVRSEAVIYLIRPDGTREALTSDEYAQYHPQGDEEFDFSEFDVYPINPRIIADVFGELKSAVSQDGLDSVVILTARAEEAPVRQFMADNGVPGIEVHATGTSNPMAKALFVLNKVGDGEFGAVRLFEDNPENIRAIGRVLAPLDVELEPHLIPH